MKKTIILAVALFAAVAVCAQEGRNKGFRLPDSMRYDKLALPDSLAHMSPWHPAQKVSGFKPSKPSVTMTSVIVVETGKLPSRVSVIDNNTLRLGSRFNLSNGQAWNSGPFPDAYLDARTLSFPGRR